MTKLELAAEMDGLLTNIEESLINIELAFGALIVTLGILAYVYITRIMRKK